MLALWRRGYAADCKSVYSGSNPDSASKRCNLRLCRRLHRLTAARGALAQDLRPGMLMDSVQPPTQPTRDVRLDAHPGASRGASLPPESWVSLHADAARQDGLIKILLGLVMLVMPASLALAGIVGIRVLAARGHLMAWSLALGIPALLLCLCGALLIGWGVLKLLAGRGAG